jgi:hypothetical protein
MDGHVAYWRPVYPTYLQKVGCKCYGNGYMAGRTTLPTHEIHGGTAPCQRPCFDLYCVCSYPASVDPGVGGGAWLRRLWSMQMAFWQLTATSPPLGHQMSSARHMGCHDF